MLLRVVTVCRLVGSRQLFGGIYSLRRRQLLDDLDEKRRYWKLKEEALDRTLWRTRFERGYGPVAREITERTNIAFIFRVDGMTWLFSGPIHLSKICQRIFRRMFCAVYRSCTRKCAGMAIKGLNPRGTSAARILFARSQVLRSDVTHTEVVPNSNKCFRFTSSS